MSEKPAAGPWMRLEDAPWAKDGHSILGDWEGEGPNVAYWDDVEEAWCAQDGDYLTEDNPVRVAEIRATPMGVIVIYHRCTCGGVREWVKRLWRCKGE